MRLIILIIVASSLAISSQGQIADVQQKGNSVYVYDASGNQLSSKSFDSGFDVKAYSSTFFVVKNGNQVYTYNEKCEHIADISLSDGADSGYTITGASGDNFTVKYGNTIYTYDRYCKHVSSRSL